MQKINTQEELYKDIKGWRHWPHGWRGTLVYVIPLWGTGFGVMWSDQVKLKIKFHYQCPKTFKNF